eukprot:6050110-Pyramimonas_sp.AAC.1
MPHRIPHSPSNGREPTGRVDLFSLPDDPFYVQTPRPKSQLAVKDLCLRSFPGREEEEEEGGGRWHPLFFPLRTWRARVRMLTTFGRRQLP